MVEKADKPKSAIDKSPPSSLILEWAKVLLPVFVSWPIVGLVVVILFHDAITGLVVRFSQSTEGKAELGPLKITLGAPVFPPQYRPQTPEQPQEFIDLSLSIGGIGDTGPEGTTVGFAIAYAIQAKASANGKKDLAVSPRGIYTIARRFDEFPGEDYEGTSLLGALKGGTAEGVYLAKDWPYASKALPNSSIKPAFKISGFKSTKSIPQILNALREGNVVAATIQVTDSFDTPSKDGRVTLKLPLRSMGSKAIAIVGYDAKTAEFKFANDWGTSWGAKGFGMIKDTDLSKILEDGYTVEI